MQRKVQLIFVVLVVTMSLVDALRCPDGADYGWWIKDSDRRCILRCLSGYEPDGCHVIRKKGSEWNHPLPNCIEESSVSTSAKAAMAAAGVLAGSIAAWFQDQLQGFALSRSAVVVGMTVTTKVAIGGTVAAVKSGYEPDGCHVIREKGSEWNHPVPSCIEESSVSTSAKAAMAAGGVLAGSIAAWFQDQLQRPEVWFALLPSAGAAGMAVMTKAAIGGTTVALNYAYDSSKCERE